jgi:hypothetical protein
METFHEFILSEVLPMGLKLVLEINYFILEFCLQFPTNQMLILLVWQMILIQ